MKFRAETTLWLLVGTHEEGSTDDFDNAPTNVQHAALRAIVEHLGAEETIAALGTDANAKQFADAQTRDAIRAAGYDPDQVGAAQCIQSMADNIAAALKCIGDKSYPAAIQALMHGVTGTVLDVRRLLSERDSWEQLADERADRITDLEEDLAKAETGLTTARAQLREWRETVGPVVDALDQLDKPTARRTEQLRYKLVHALRQRAPRIRRLLSATPDEQQGPVGPMVPAGERDRWRERAHEAQARTNNCNVRLAAIEDAIRQSLSMLDDDETTPYDYVELIKEAGRQLVGGDTRQRSCFAKLNRVRDVLLKVGAVDPLQDNTIAGVTDFTGSIKGIANERGRYRNEYENTRAQLETARKTMSAAVRRAESAEADARTARQANATEVLCRERAEKRVEELEEDVRNLRISLEHCTEANNRRSKDLVAERDRATRASTAVSARVAVNEWAHVDGADARGNAAAENHIIDAYGDTADNVRQALDDYDANKPEPTDEQPQARAGGKSELVIQCGVTDLGRLAFSNGVGDWVELRACDCVWLIERDDIRRLRDWLTAWLGDSDGYDAVARVALQQARAWRNGRNGDGAMLAIAKEISWSVYRCDPDKGPIVVERNGGGE